MKELSTQFKTFEGVFKVSRELQQRWIGELSVKVEDVLQHQGTSNLERQTSEALKKLAEISTFYDDEVLNTLERLKGNLARMSIDCQMQLATDGQNVIHEIREEIARARVSTKGAATTRDGSRGSSRCSSPVGVRFGGAASPLVPASPQAAGFAGAAAVTAITVPRGREPQQLQHIVAQQPLPKPMHSLSSGACALVQTPAMPPPPPTFRGPSPPTQRPLGSSLRPLDAGAGATVPAAPGTVLAPAPAAFGGGGGSRGPSPPPTVSRSSGSLLATVTGGPLPTRGQAQPPFPVTVSAGGGAGSGCLAAGGCFSAGIPVGAAAAARSLSPPARFLGPSRFPSPLLSGVMSPPMGTMRPSGMPLQQPPRFPGAFGAPVPPPAPRGPSTAVAAAAAALESASAWAAPQIRASQAERCDWAAMLARTALSPSSPKVADSSGMLSPRFPPGAGANLSPAPCLGAGCVPLRPKQQQAKGRLGQSAAMMGWPLQLPQQAQHPALLQQQQQLLLLQQQQPLHQMQQRQRVASPLRGRQLEGPPLGHGLRPLQPALLLGSCGAFPLPPPGATQLGAARPAASRAAVEEYSL